MKLVELPDSGSGAASPGTSKPSGAAAAVPDLDQLLASIPASGLDDRKLESLAAKSPKHAAEPAAGDTEATGEGAEIPDFAAVYRAAGIEVPAHGYSAFKILEILESPDLAPLDAKAKAAALGGFLKMNPGGPVPLSDVIQDAVRRDQALDRFEEFLRGKLETRAAEAERQNAALQAEIDELSRKNRETMETNRRALEAERAGLESWRARKESEERRLFEAIAPFVDQNPITTGPIHPPGASNAPAKDAS
ncbi:MAG TPA: cell division protein ZapB [Thermoanaerobaculia bacterium]|nr:cell division protein ZapB [Thermoanaerobaculia bacterium]